MTAAPAIGMRIQAPGSGEALLALGLCVALLGVVHWRAGPPEPPRADALRYLDYSINLLEYGIFGLGDSGGAPPAGRANTPLYPLFVAAALNISGAEPPALRCLLRSPPASCPPVPGVVYGAQAVLAALGLFAIWLLAWQLIGTRRGAALAAGAALLSAQPQAYTGQLLTENLSLPLFAVFTFAITRLAAGGGLRWEAVTGASLGLLTLTRPEFLYLALAVLALRVLWALAAPAPRRHSAWTAVLALVAACALIVVPWSARNYATFGDPALTETYGGQILAQRVQYNRMTAAEFGAAFVYWLPDFGDSLARRMLPESSYRRLGFQPGTYYADGLAYHAKLARERGGDAAATAALLREDVLGHPVKHGLVTLALAWRGVFIAKLWGLGGLLAFVAVLIRRSPARAAFARASWPAWFMLLFYAAVSVAIPRYSVCFVPIFSVALALSLGRLFEPRAAPA